MELPEDEILQDPIAYRIWCNIILSLDEYTDDSPLARFYMPERLTVHCQPIAAAYTSILYTPPLDLENEEFLQSHAYYIFLLASFFGVHIYLEERAFRTGRAPFAIGTDPEQIDLAKKSALTKLTTPSRVDPVVEQVMDKFLLMIGPATSEEKLTIPNKKISSRKYTNFIPAALFWGYYFASQMVIDTQPLYPQFDKISL
jgi:hypothetical protein